VLVAIVECAIARLARPEEVGEISGKNQMFALSMSRNGQHCNNCENRQDSDERGHQNEVTRFFHGGRLTEESAKREAENDGNLQPRITRKGANLISAFA